MHYLQRSAMTVYDKSDADTFRVGEGENTFFIRHIYVCYSISVRNIFVTSLFPLFPCLKEEPLKFHRNFILSCCIE